MGLSLLSGEVTSVRSTPQGPPFEQVLDETCGVVVDELLGDL